MVIPVAGLKLNVGAKRKLPFMTRLALALPGGNLFGETELMLSKPAHAFASGTTNRSPAATNVSEARRTLRDLISRSSALLTNRMPNRCLELRDLHADFGGMW